MNRYNKYNIKEADRFDSNDFPKVQVELEDLLKATEGITATNKEEILISYLRDQSIEKKWSENNPELSSLLSDGNLITIHMQALFESSHANKAFQRGFEDYIREALSQPAS